MRAKGINVKLDGDSILNITEISFGGTSWATEDVTSHNSTTPVAEITPTIRQDGTIDLTLSPFLPADPVHQSLRDMSQSGATDTFTVTYPGSTLGTFSFTGFVQSFTFDTPVDGIYKASTTIQPVAAILDQAASITSLTVTDAFEGTYADGDAMKLTAAFDEVVVVTGTPRIAVVLDSGTVYANYTAGSGTNTLAFSKTFGESDLAGAGEVSITSPVDLNGGSIKDMGGNVAALTFTPPNTSAFTVN